MKSKDRIFSGKRRAAYQKAYQQGMQLAWGFLMDLERNFGADRFDLDARISASNCAIEAPGVIMPDIHGPHRRYYFNGGANCI